MELTADEKLTMEEAMGLLRCCYSTIRRYTKPGYRGVVLRTVKLRGKYCRARVDPGVREPRRGVYERVRRLGRRAGDKALGQDDARLAERNRHDDA